MIRLRISTKKEYYPDFTMDISRRCIVFHIWKRKVGYNHFPFFGTDAMPDVYFEVEKQKLILAEVQDLLYKRIKEFTKFAMHYNQEFAKKHNSDYQLFVEVASSCFGDVDIDEIEVPVTPEYYIYKLQLLEAMLKKSIENNWYIVADAD
jgi:hypothetical protein